MDDEMDQIMRAADARVRRVEDMLRAAGLTLDGASPPVQVGPLGSDMVTVQLMAADPAQRGKDTRAVGKMFADEGWTILYDETPRRGWGGMRALTAFTEDA